MVAATLEE
jgi:hypothetical protein